LSQGLVGNYVDIRLITSVHDARWTVAGGGSVYEGRVIVDFDRCIVVIQPFALVPSAIDAKILLFSRILSIFGNKGVVNFAESLESIIFLAVPLVEHRRLIRFVHVIALIVPRGDGVVS
jgi:hypothetical protein